MDDSYCREYGHLWVQQDDPHSVFCGNCGVRKFVSQGGATKYQFPVDPVERERQWLREELLRQQASDA